MPDHDWVRYKSIRGKPLPQTGDWLGTPWRLVKVLKFDFYAATGLYEEAQARQGLPARSILVKFYHEDRLFNCIPLRWLGRWLASREVRSLRAVSGIVGIPALLEPVGGNGLLREFVPGCNLREHGKEARLPDAFFPELKAILRKVHDRGISHNDLSKPENILVDPAGRPWLIDFQIALGAWGPIRRLALRPLVRYMQGVDQYHLNKIHRRFRPFDFSADELANARRKGFIITLHGYIRRPYRKLRHWILDRYFTADAQAAQHPASTSQQPETAGTHKSAA